MNWFWSKVDVRGPDDCWEWQGGIHGSTGYGRFKRKGIQYHTHRVAFGLDNIPEGHQVNHHCDNRKCCNPAHLYAGTQKDNMQDRKKRGRWRGGNKLSSDDVVEIKSLLGVIPQWQIGDIFGVGQSQISRIACGESVNYDYRE